MNINKNRRSTPLWIVTIIVVAICIFCIIISTCFFIYNQLKFANEYSDASRKIRDHFTNQLSNISPDTEREQLIIEIEKLQITMIQNTIKHLEQIHLLQKNTTSNEVMSFVYIMLSTILISLCMIFIERGYNSVKESRESANESKENAAKAMSDANKTKEDLEKTNNLANDIITRLEEVEKNANEAMKNAASAIEDSNNSSILAKDVTTDLQNVQEAIRNEKAERDLLSVKIRILHAKEALRLELSADINECVKAVYNEVNNLSNNMAYSSNIKIQKEINELQIKLDEYREKIEILPEDDGKQSKLTSIDWCSKKLEEAIKHCKDLIKTINNP
jgi:hypothetical protein